jgi:hypothetical protein
MEWGALSNSWMSLQPLIHVSDVLGFNTGFNVDRKSPVAQKLALPTSKNAAMTPLLAQIMLPLLPEAEEVESAEGRR